MEKTTENQFRHIKGNYGEQELPTSWMYITLKIYETTNDCDRYKEIIAFLSKHVGDVDKRGK